MNLRAKLESKEGQWVKIYFPDGTSLTGYLRHVGVDFVQIETYGRDELNHDYAQHVIPMSFVKFITIEASSFIEAERKRLEYISRKSSSGEDF